MFRSGIEAPGGVGLLSALCLATLAGSAAAQSNLLLVIADDLGVDRVGAYAAHPEPGHTPVLDQLAADGVLFRNAWANPTCSPTRATLLTGRYAFRTGIGKIVAPIDAEELGLDEATLPALLPAGYRSAAVGKWHLAASEVSGFAHPQLLGFEHHRGSISNFADASTGLAYDDWQKLVDGVPEWSNTYATTDSVDEALALIDGFGDEPWFVWLAFNAPHKPFHHPPAALHSFDLPATVAEDPPLFMQAATEAMDTELGRLLASLDPAVLADTVVIVVGDNGTVGEAVTAPFDPARAKGTLYEGGVHVPLIVKGPGVAAGAECAALVNSTDLFATLLELAGARSSAEDSVSLAPYLADPALPSLRPWIYAERFSPNGSPLFAVQQRAVRGPRYKLIQIWTAETLIREELFDLELDAFELDDLLLQALDAEAQAALLELRGVLDELTLDPWQDIWSDFGLGMPGVAGLPGLQGSGSVLPGEPFSVELAGAAPQALSALMLGLDWIAVPFKFGTLLPAPDLVALLSTDALGEISLQGSWTPGVPSGTKLFVQCWIVDATAPGGVAGSNALGLLVP